MKQLFVLFAVLAIACGGGISRDENDYPTVYAEIDENNTGGSSVDSMPEITGEAGSPSIEEIGVEEGGNADVAEDPSGEAGRPSNTGGSPATGGMVQPEMAGSAGAPSVLNGGSAGGLATGGVPSRQPGTSCAIQVNSNQEDSQFSWYLKSGQEGFALLRRFEATIVGDFWGLDATLPSSQEFPIDNWDDVYGIALLLGSEEVSFAVSQRKTSQSATAPDTTRGYLSAPFRYGATLMQPWNDGGTRRFDLLVHGNGSEIREVKPRRHSQVHYRRGRNDNRLVR